jgi:NADH:ubiquinone oxidoreductase subunit 2 (subunit N)
MAGEGASERYRYHEPDDVKKSLDSSPGACWRSRWYYLVAYFAMTLRAFGNRDGQAEIDALDDYRGLPWRRPWLGGVFTATLLSLAGYR